MPSSLTRIFRRHHSYQIYQSLDFLVVETIKVVSNKSTKKERVLSHELLIQVFEFLQTVIVFQ